MLSIGIALLLATPAANAAPLAKDAAEKSVDARDTMICKRFPVTGSLVQTYRSCKSKADWQRERDAIRANTASGYCGPSEMGSASC